MTRNLIEAPARLFQPGAPIPPHIVDLGLGYPDLATMPRLGLSTEALSPGRLRSALSYGPLNGNTSLIAALSQTVTRDVVGPRATLITNGAMDALILVLQTLASPGDVLLAEEHTFPGLIAAAADAGVELVAVATDTEGVDPDALIEITNYIRASGRRIAGLYLMPTASNPTGLCVPQDRRRAIADAAGQLELLVIEDDAYRDVFFGDTAPMPIFNILPDLTIHIRTLSKVLCPGVRLAVVYGPPAIIADMASRRAVGGTSPFASELVANVLETVDYDDHLTNLRALYQRRRDLALSAIDRCPSLEAPTPQAGFFLWLKLPEGLEGRTVHEHALTAGVRILPGAAFAIDATADHKIRLSYSYVPPTQLLAGIELLGNVVDALMCTGG